ncbi:MAG: tRNA 2-thiouridine(34) synthase MnmA [Bacteriovoracaceae bacterium]|jgi:tRNA-uridine 2-sulfurtransferase|nr:tRNA 2-thiouridine(34) synthase MnmA [Bacteriovoracaceae bacterium]
MNFSPKKPSTIVVGMSGGVDSSVALALLKQRGHKVIGLFMRNWEEIGEDGVCTSEADYRDVVSVCEKLDVPYYSVDFVKEYKENVFDSFVEEFKLGHTPNPDVLCNREIKFNVFFKMAMDLGADYLATGHYCQHLKINGRSTLAKGLDANKDQSYFLYTMKQQVLEKVVFPIGDLEKPEVRKIALELGLSTSKKKDSTGICFIGERNFKNFLSQYISFKRGPFKTLDETSVGEHSGASFYTIGQRKGLGLGGPGLPWFVVGKDVDTNTVYVERGGDHPALFSQSLTGMDVSWVGPAPELPLRCMAKVRYRGSDIPCVVKPLNDSKIEVNFEAPVRAIVSRQSVVFYKDNECLGGAIIDSPGENFYQSGRSSLPKIVPIQV